jgi:ABC-type Na+ transport system ATPase subunit NatA
VKPAIKRRHRQAVLDEIARAKAEGRAPVFAKHLSESVHA